MMRLCCSVLLLLIVACAPVFARDAEGRLAGVIAPNDGRPAVVVPGEAFEVLLDFQPEQGALSATLHSGAGTFSCDVLEIWHNPHNTRSSVRVAVPGDVAPGLHALRVSHGGETFDMPRAVQVLPSDKPHVVLACVGNVRVGAEETTTLERILLALNDSDADGVVLVGSLTQNGAPEEYRALLRALAQSTRPTWLVPGPGDNERGQFAAHFGDPVYLVRLGRDALLAFDTGAPHATAPGGRQAGLLHQFRRECRNARWTVVLTHAMPAITHLRYPLALFVDDPVDAVVQNAPSAPAAMDADAETPETEGSEAGSLAGVAWAKTRIITLPEGGKGAYLLVDLLEGGVLPRGVQTVAVAE